MHRVIAWAEKPSILVDFGVQWLPENEQKLLFRTQCETAEKAILSFGESCGINCSEQHILAVTLPDMPVGITLELPLRSFDRNDEKNEYEMVLIILAFPYTTKSQFDMLEDVSRFLRNKADAPKRFCIVMQNNIRAGVSDLNTSGSVLKEINEHLENEKLSEAVNVVSESKSLIEVFRGADKSFGAAIKAEDDNIKEWRDGKLKRYDEEFKFSIGHNAKLEPDDFEKYFRFNEVEKCLDIFKKYSDNFFKSKEWETIKEKSCELFRQYIKSICCWDIDKDVQEFSKQLEYYARKELSFKDVIRGPVRESEYEDIRAKTKCDIIFMEKFKKFISGLYSFINKQIRMRGKVYFPDLQNGD